MSNTVALYFNSNHCFGVFSHAVTKKIHFLIFQPNLSNQDRELHNRLYFLLMNTQRAESSSPQILKNKPKRLRYVCVYFRTSLKVTSGCLVSSSLNLDVTLWLGTGMLHLLSDHTIMWPKSRCGTPRHVFFTSHLIYYTSQFSSVNLISTRCILCIFCFNASMPALTKGTVFSGSPSVLSISKQQISTWTRG